MSAMSSASLFDFISENLDLIIEDWAAFAVEIFAPHEIDIVEARDHARGILIDIATDIGRPQTPLEQAEKSKGRAPDAPDRKSAAAQHGAGRFFSGLKLNAQVSEFRALRASVLRLWGQANPQLPPSALQDLTSSPP
jgi:hypothetical protein